MGRVYHGGVGVSNGTVDFSHSFIITFLTDRLLNNRTGEGVHSKDTIPFQMGATGCHHDLLGKEDRMKSLLCAAAVAALVVLTVGQTGAKNLAPKTIKEVMAEGHKAPKGETPLCGKANAGKATKEEAAKLLALYEDMARGKPSKGDEASWKSKCEALIAATKKLAANPEDKDAVAAYKAAVNCMGCHSAHRGK
jgi:hypothetical protein